ncbi:hypothetical protein ACHAQA_004383 [Verticillium albo-atrum]
MASKIGHRGCDLKQLALHLLEKGFLKTEMTSRRIRIIHGGVTIVDTTKAMLAWEHASYPQYYVPNQDLKNCAVTQLELVENPDTPQPRQNMYFEILKVSPASKDRQPVGPETRRVLRMRTIAPPSNIEPWNGMVRFEFGVMDQWLEEDTPIYVHPKDPFKRIDLLMSRREIRIDYKGIVLARSSYSIHLWETGLPTRYYLPYTAVNQGLVHLVKTDTVTECPYKGTAGYYTVDLGFRGTLEDLIWYYRHPTIECAAIAGMVCFYNEKVSIQLNGKVVEEPEVLGAPKEPEPSSDVPEFVI